MSLLQQQIGAVLEQHRQTNLELGLKSQPAVQNLKRGDYVEIAVIYHDDPPLGTQGRVIRAWKTPHGTEWATIHFGKNLTGQNLRKKFPVSTLRKISGPTGKYVDRLKASTDRRLDQALREALDRVRETNTVRLANPGQKGKRGNPVSNAVIEVNGASFPVFAKTTGYGTTGDMLPVYAYYIVGSYDFNPSGRMELGLTKTIKALVSALQREQHKIVKPRNLGY